MNAQTDERSALVRKGSPGIRGRTLCHWLAAMAVLLSAIALSACGLRVSREDRALHALFSSGEAGQRQAAAMELISCGPAAVETMLSRLETEDSSAEERHAAFNGIMDACREGGTPAIIPLVNAFSSEQPEVRWQAYGLLVRLGEPAVDALGAHLDDDGPGVRVWAAFALLAAAERMYQNCGTQSVWHRTQQSKRLARRALEGATEDQVTVIVSALSGAEEWHYVNETGILPIIGANAITPVIAALKREVDTPRVQSYVGTGGLSPKTSEITKALVALRGYLEIEPVLLKLIDEPSPPVQSCASYALARLNTLGAREALVRRAGYHSVTAAIHDYPRVIEEGIPGTEGLLILATWDLARAGDTASAIGMAENLLNCGNPVLDLAMREWADEEGCVIVTRPGEPVAKWGGGLPRTR